MKTNREDFQKLFPLTLKGMEESIKTELAAEFDLYADERHADGSLAIFSVGKEDISCFFASNFNEDETFQLNKLLADNELDWIKNNIQRRENGSSFLIIPEVSMKYHLPSLLTVAFGETIFDDSWDSCTAFAFKTEITEEDETGKISSIKIYSALNSESTLFQRDIEPLDYLLDEARWFIETYEGNPISFLMESFDSEDEQLLKTLFGK